MKHFITYGDERFSQSRERIRREAEDLGLFDSVKTYSPNDLSADFRQNPLFAYERGGGYWCWKPWITLRALQEVGEGDIVCYCDSGCTLYASAEWQRWFHLLRQRDMLFFRIITRCGQFTKRSMFSYFEPVLGRHWNRYFQVAGTVYLVRNTAATRQFFEEELSLFTPEMIVDVRPEEMSEQLPGFIEHRHDQSLLSALVYKHLPEGHIHVLTNTFETVRPGQAILATRLRNGREAQARPAKGFISQHISRPVGNLLRNAGQYYWMLRNTGHITWF